MEATWVCISYLLCHNKWSHLCPKCWLKKPNIFNLTVSVCQEFGDGLTMWFFLRVSHRGCSQDASRLVLAAQSATGRKNSLGSHINVKFHRKRRIRWMGLDWPIKMQQPPAHCCSASVHACLLSHSLVVPLNTTAAFPNGAQDSPSSKQDTWNSTGPPPKNWVAPVLQHHGSYHFSESREWNW